MKQAKRLFDPHEKQVKIALGLIFIGVNHKSYWASVIWIRMIYSIKEMLIWLMDVNLVPVQALDPLHICHLNSAAFCEVIETRTQICSRKTYFYLYFSIFDWCTYIDVNILVHINILAFTFKGCESFDTKDNTILWIWKCKRFAVFNMSNGYRDRFSVQVTSAINIFSYNPTRNNTSLNHSSHFLSHFQSMSENPVPNMIP